MKKFFLISALVLAALWACTPQEQPGKDNGKTTEDSITLVSESTVSVPVDGDIVTVKFKSTADWTAASDADWLTVSTASGKAGEDCSVKASATKNETYDNRSAKITITAGKAKAEVTVNQLQLNGLNIKTLEYEVSAEGGNVEVEVESNVDYEVTIPEAVDWVHDAATKGMETSKVTFTVDPSYDEEVREANIKISAGDISSSIKISQAAFVPYYDMELPEGAGMFSGFGDGDPIVLEADATSFTIPVSTNMEHYCYFAPWDSTVGAAVETNDVGWIKFEYDNTKIVFTLEPNTTYLDREEYFYSGCFVGDVDFGAYGSCILIRQKGLIPEAGASVIWTKTLAECEVPAAYNRLAYKTDGGDALLVSDGEKIHVLNPADGSHWKSIQWTNIKPTSICSDENGVIVAAEDIPFSNGSHYTIYYTTDVNEDPKPLIEHDADFDGTLGSIRVRGKLAERAVVTGFITGNRYWAGWEIDNYAISMDNYYAQGTGGQARGPIAVDADAWDPESGAVMSVSNKLDKGIVYRAYDTNWCLHYLKDAYTPNWLTPYDWKVISEAGAGAGNENQNNMDIIDYQGRRIIAYTQGVWFSWGGNRDVFFLDITDPEACEVLAILPGDSMAAGDAIDANFPYADVKLHIEEGVGLVCYVVNSAYNSISKLLLTL